MIWIHLARCECRCRLKLFNAKFLVSPDNGLMEPLLGSIHSYYDNECVKLSRKTFETFPRNNCFYTIDIFARMRASLFMMLMFCLTVFSQPASALSEAWVTWLEDGGTSTDPSIGPHQSPGGGWGQPIQAVPGPGNWWEEPLLGPGGITNGLCHLRSGVWGSDWLINVWCTFTLYIMIWSWIKYW